MKKTITDLLILAMVITAGIFTGLEIYQLRENNIQMDIELQNSEQLAQEYRDANIELMQENFELRDKLNMIEAQNDAENYMEESNGN